MAAEAERVQRMIPDDVDVAEFVALTSWPPACGNRQGGSCERLDKEEVPYSYGERSEVSAGDRSVQNPPLLNHLPNPRLASH